MDFFKRYHQIMFTTFLIVLLVFSGIFYLQFNGRYKSEMNRLASKLQERVLTLDYQMKTANDAISNMQMQMQYYLATNQGWTTPSDLFLQLKESSKKDYYHLDNVRQPFEKDMIGNLTGLGSLEDRSLDFYGEIEMALATNPLLRATFRSIPNVAWVYYVSANRFINMYPWTASQDFTFSEDLFQHEFYTLALPQKNPKRQLFWTNAYIDAAGKGLMVSCSAPVYERYMFRGIIAIDFTLDTLKASTKNFEYQEATLFIVNQSQQLLAHPTSISAEDTTVKLAEEALPPLLRPHLQEIVDLPKGTAAEIEGYMVIHEDLQYIPWKVILWIPKQIIVFYLIINTHWVLLILLPGLALILIMANRLIREEFIQPSERLIKHIEKESQNIPSPIPKLPTGWYRWFVEVSVTFEENRFLMSELKSYTESLEATVAERTQEVMLLNERLKADNLRMSAELDVTHRLQQMLLPKNKELQKIPHLDIVGFMQPAEEVGGDYYDVLQHDGRVKIGIGDVTGHGLESSVLMLMVQTAVRALLINNETDPVKFMNTLNRTIYDNIQRMDSDRNLSLSLLDYHNGHLYLSGQHEELIIVRVGGYIERIDTTNLGFPLGLEEDIARFVAQTQILLNLGDTAILYTDGITEAENQDRELYGLERLCGVVKRNWQRSANGIRQAIIDDVRWYIGKSKVFDDITLVVIKRR